ncbi:hypothetical protein Sa4125_35020 [Aureimonas sp. SA4125]|uniref:hypothetical protein n=1 Tax=Aureimonas sp. SA4125 TaxID=2826993 RepID=UPI001CC37F46|nr:hypothetical protein [Aureimonas sp. SA4125]BDA85960.1 hypothetical protein Sa4125_35020 [Aureimonas sp. SA4125]
MRSNFALTWISGLVYFLSGNIFLAVIAIIANFESGVRYFAVAYSWTKQKIDWITSENDYDLNFAWSCDYTTAGNIFTKKGQTNFYSPLDLREAEIISVKNHNSQKFIAEKTAYNSIRGNYGMLHVNKNGYYTYIYEQNQPNEDHTENFEFEYYDAEGLSKILPLKIKVFVAEKSANKLIDYGNQITGPNHLFNGTNFYKTSVKTGAIIFGHTANDRLMGLLIPFA